MNARDLAVSSVRGTALILALAGALGPASGMGTMTAWASASAREDAPGEDCPGASSAVSGIDDRCGAELEQDREGAGYPMEHVAVRDQGETNTCYAHTAVEQVDAWRFSHGDTRYGLRSSALGAAIGAGTDPVLSGHWDDYKQDVYRRRTHTEIGPKFLIRNSWGQGCGSYHDSRVANCTEPNEKGDVWVSSDAVSDNVYWYSYVHE